MHWRNEERAVKLKISKHCVYFYDFFMPKIAFAAAAQFPAASRVRPLLKEIYALQFWL